MNTIILYWRPVDRQARAVPADADVCGRTWELCRVRAENAICRCGATLTCLDDEPPAQPAPAKGRE